MSNQDDPGLKRSEHYETIKNTMLADMNARMKDIDELPIGVRGLAKVGFALLKAVAIPVIAFFSSIAENNRESQEILLDRPAGKMKVSRDREWWVDVLQKFGYDSDTIAAIDNLIPDNIPGPNIVQFLFISLLFLTSAGSIVQIISSTAQKDLFAKYHPTVPNPESILRASFVAPEMHGEVLRALKQSGLSEEDIKLLFLANYSTQDIGTIREVFYREGKDQEWVDNRLSELGFTPERIGEIKATFPVIPGIQDLIMMQAKEAFEPALIARFGLGAEYPTDILEWTRKQGLSDEWTEKYWSSHWQHPPFGQVMEMLWRTELTLDDVWEWYKLVEIPPFWRNYLTEIAYHPYTRVDVRRMHDVGILSDEQLQQSYEDLGFNQEKAEGMAEFTKRYNTRTGKTLSRSDIEKAYEDRDLTYGEAIGLLKSVGYEAEIAAFYLSRIELEMERATRLERIDLTKEKLLSGLISESDARNLLVGYGVDIKRVNELLDRWSVQIIKNTKLPSKTDLDKFFRHDIITEAQYVEQMIKIGYSTGYIDWYIKLIQKGIES